MRSRSRRYVAILSGHVFIAAFCFVVLFCFVLLLDVSACACDFVLLCYCARKFSTFFCFNIVQICRIYKVLICVEHWKMNKCFMFEVNSSHPDINHLGEQ